MNNQLLPIPGFGSGLVDSYTAPWAGTIPIPGTGIMAAMPAAAQLTAPMPTAIPPPQIPISTAGLAPFTTGGMIGATLNHSQIPIYSGQYAGSTLGQNGFTAAAKPRGQRQPSLAEQSIQSPTPDSSAPLIKQREAAKLTPEQQARLPQHCGIITETNSGKRKRSYQHILDPAERRRVRNRESAKLARANKKNYLTQLEGSERELKQCNDRLKEENGLMMVKMKELIGRSGLKPEEVEAIVGSNFFDETYNSDDDDDYVGNYEREEPATKVMIKQEYDGLASSVTTIGKDVQGFVTINRNPPAGTHFTLSPPPEPAIPVSSMSGNTAYGTEKQSFVPASSIYENQYLPPPNSTPRQPLGPPNMDLPKYPAFNFLGDNPGAFSYDPNLLQSAAGSAINNNALGTYGLMPSMPLKSDIIENNLANTEQMTTVQNAPTTPDANQSIIDQAFVLSEL